MRRDIVTLLLCLAFAAAPHHAAATPKEPYASLDRFADVAARISTNCPAMFPTAMHAAIERINAMPDRADAEPIVLKRKVKVGEKVDRASLKEFLNAIADAAGQTTDLRYFVRTLARAMLRSVDPDNGYSAFNSGPLVFDAELGLSLEPGEAGSWVTRVAAGSSAETAGMVVGDLILAINDEDTRELIRNELYRLVTGPSGATARLVVRHEGDATPVTIDLVYEPSSKQEPQTRPFGVLPPPGIAIITLPGLHDEADAHVRDVLLNAKVQDEKVTGVVLDLRGNGGGLLDQIEKVADIFLGKGQIGLTKTDGCFGNEDVVQKTEGGGEAEETPVVVLIDGDTTSGGAMLAAVLSDGGRAKTVGQTTRGSWKVWTLIPVGNDAVMQVVSSRFIPPSGERAEGQGLKPVIETPTPDGDRDYAMEKALELLTAPTSP